MKLSSILIAYFAIITSLLYQVNIINCTNFIHYFFYPSPICTSIYFTMFQVNGAQQCSGNDPFACWGNGECINDSYCKCSPGWKGEECNMLDLLPIRRSSPGLILSDNWPNDKSNQWTTNPNWGGSAIWEDGYWYLVVGMKKDPWGSDYFSENSGIFKLRSQDIGGPYENLGEITGSYGQSFGFRADMKRHPVDNSILIVVDGDAGWGNGNDPGFGFTMLRFHTGSINGPFTEHNLYKLGRKVQDENGNMVDDWSADPNNSDNTRFDCRLADPTLTILNDGKVLVGYRGTKCCGAKGLNCDNLIGTWGNCGQHEYETASLLTADSWDGTYVRSGVPMFQGLTDNEDMFLWTDAKGVHMLAHSQDNSHHNHERRGAYGFSPDGGKTWKLSKDFDAWHEDYLVFDDCSGYNIEKKQRPTIVFHPDNGHPMYLMSGIAGVVEGVEVNGLKWGDGWTVLQPINSGSTNDRYSTKCSVTGGECCEKKCPVGKIGDGATGTCLDVCGSSSMVQNGDCLVGDIASNGCRDTCTCNSCKKEKFGESCEYEKDTESKPCEHEGWKTLVGTQFGFGNGELATGTGGKYFRCGGCDFNTNTPFGWYGNCIPGGGECNGVWNCGDGADELNCDGFEKLCEWPKVKINGVCRECTINDVNMGNYPQYATCTEAFPNANQDECTCIKGKENGTRKDRNSSHK